MFPLPDAHHRILLGIARESVDARLAGRDARLPEVLSPELLVPRGLFVSIHKHDALRGCIGNVHATVPVYRAAAECAVAAAFSDPRFTPIQKAELPQIKFEISVLSQLDPVKDVDDIRVGTHGVFICRGAARGLLLPQVATQYHWDAVRFVSETCRKAGLAPDAWKHGALIYRFSADVFGEQRVRQTAIS